MRKLIIHILQLLPVFRGKYRLARVALGRYITQSRDIVVNGRNHIKYRVPNFVENVGFEILVNGEYERESIEFISKRIKLGKTFIDIGANIGAISVPIARKFPDVRVISVEASDRLVDYLSFNINENKLINVTLIGKAVAQEADETIPFYSPETKFGKGSMSPIFTNSANAVLTTTIDRLVSDLQIDEVGFIKIDIEGYEYFAFKGGESTMRSERAPDVLFEFVDWAESGAGLTPGSAQEILVSYGYSIYVVEKNQTLRNVPILRTGSLMLFATKQNV